MEPEGTTAPPLSGRRGMALVAALATLWCSAAIGSVAVGRWRRAAFWLVTEWMWLGLFVGGVHRGHPWSFWVGTLGFLLWRVPAAIDAFRLVRTTPAPARWQMIVVAWMALTLATVGALRGIRQFLVEAFAIPAGSMLPTLDIGDRIMVDKRARRPIPGDVIVFEFPLDRSTSYVKRVVAVGGDVVQIDDGQLVVNGKEVWRERVQNGCADELDVEPRGPCVIWEETLGEHRYQTGYDKLGGPRYTDRRVVKPGTVFVLGDNRDNSSDSRVWGDVPLENIKGTVRFVWWSADSARVNRIVR